MSKNNAGSKEYLFSQVPQANIPRCRLRRPKTHKTTINAGLLYPIYWDEVIPGDTHTINFSAFGRMATQVVPTMDNLYLDVQFFFVPYRLVWEHWERMHGDQPNPGDSIDFSVPYIKCPAGGIQVGSLADYFGLPLGVEWGDHDVNCLAFRAYNLIWNEWYRDENLQNRAPQDNSDGYDLMSNYNLLPRNKRKDYFTSALPWPQKGATVELPLGSTAHVSVYGTGATLGFDSLSPAGYWNVSGTVYSEAGIALDKGAYDKPSCESYTPLEHAKFGTTVGITTNPNKSGLVGTAHLDQATSATINDIREAFQVQRLLERDALGGTRYRELLKSHYGVVSPDSRLQVPEFLGSATYNLNVQQVVQSSQTGTTPQGNLSAMSTFNGVSRGIVNKSFVEWGCIIGLASVRSDLSYQQGINRIWSKATRFDYYYPVLAHLGEQAILNKEIYAQDASVLSDAGNAQNDEAFGYQERWSEYKYGQNLITGELRSTAPQSLDVWHLAQDFGSLPVLGNDFIKENPPIERLIAVESTPAFVLDTFADVYSVRPMPLYDVPGLIDHF